MGGGQFAIGQIGEKKSKKYILSLKLLSSEEFFDLRNARNPLRTFLKCFEVSITSKKHFKGDTVERDVMVNLAWTDSNKKSKEKTTCS